MKNAKTPGKTGVKIFFFPPIDSRYLYWYDWGMTRRTPRQEPRNGETTMKTLTKNDAVAKAMAKCERAELAYNAANQAVIDAERALVLAKEARYTAQREASEAAKELKAAKEFSEGEAATSNIDWSKAKSSYSGRAGACCCGCAGNHSETSVAIKRQINRIKRLAGEGVTLDIQDSYVAAEQNDRLYIVYFN